jgi:hypothetical protein
VASALMFHARLRDGLSLVQLIRMTGSLGLRVVDDPETWQWTDTGGDRVMVELHGGKLRRWHLHRALPASPLAGGDIGNRAASTATAATPKN